MTWYRTVICNMLKQATRYELQVIYAFVIAYMRHH